MQPDPVMMFMLTAKWKYNFKDQSTICKVSQLEGNHGEIFLEFSYNILTLITEIRVFDWKSKLGIV